MITRQPRQSRSAHGRWASSAVALVLGATTPIGTHAQMVIEVSGDPSQLFDIDDAAPMGLRDVASVFPFAGPFAPVDGAPGDRFIHEALNGVDRGFLDQLMPVLQARFQAQQHPCDADVQRLCPHADAPLHCLGLSGGTISSGCTQEIKHAVPFVCGEQIDRFCDGDIEKGILACLEDHGAQLGPDCADAIVAARHAISSLGASQKKADSAMQGKAKRHQKAPAGSSRCPSGWSGPEAGGCCTKRWSPVCAATCSSNQCRDAGNDWEFHWLDFRVHPYTCCPRPKPAASKYVGGQPHCPKGWDTEPHEQGLCCRRSWSWDCGHDCSQARCAVNKGFVWVPVDEGKEHYRCCPKEHAPPPGKAKVHKEEPKKKGIARPAVAAEKARSVPDTAIDDVPDGLGSSWVGQPVNLGGWTYAAIVLGILGLCFFARRCGSQPTPQASDRFKDH